MNKNQLDNSARRAFHEAAHAVMAIDKGFEVLGLVMPGSSTTARSEFVGLSALPKLTSSEWVRTCIAVDRYVIFRLAGPAAEWILLQKHHGLEPGSDEYVRLRNRYGAERLYESQDDFDISFAMIFAWLECDTVKEAQGILNRYWFRICEALDYGLIWAKIEQIAHALLKSGQLSGDEVLEIYGTKTAQNHRQTGQSTEGRET